MYLARAKNQCLFSYYVYDKKAEIFVKGNNYVSAQGGVRIVLTDGTIIKLNLLKDNVYLLDDRILIVDSHKCRSPQLIMPENYKGIQVKLCTGRIVQYVYAEPEKRWIEL